MSAKYPLLFPAHGSPWDHKHNGNELAGSGSLQKNKHRHFWHSLLSVPLGWAHKWPLQKDQTVLTALSKQLCWLIAISGLPFLLDASSASLYRAVSQIAIKSAQCLHEQNNRKAILASTHPTDRTQSKTEKDGKVSGCGSFHYGIWLNFEGKRIVLMIRD